MGLQTQRAGQKPKTSPRSKSLALAPRSPGSPRQHSGISARDPDFRCKASGTGTHSSSAPPCRGGYPGGIRTPPTLRGEVKQVNGTAGPDSKQPDTKSGFESLSSLAGPPNRLQERLGEGTVGSSLSKTHKGGSGASAPTRWKGHFLDTKWGHRGPRSAACRACCWAVIKRGVFPLLRELLPKLKRERERDEAR